MSRQLYDNVEVSIDEVNDIVVGEEYDYETTRISKRISIVEDSINHVLKLDDDDDDENQQLRRQSIDNETIEQNEKDQTSKSSLVRKAHSYPCKGTYKMLPEHPSTWPQRPLMIRPTPYTSTKVIGIVSYIIVFFASLFFYFDNTSFL